MGRIRFDSPAHYRARSLLAPWCPNETPRCACAGGKVKSMSKQYQLPHLSLLVGILVTAATAAAGQVQTAKPGEQVERQLSGDQTFRQWSLKELDQKQPGQTQPDQKQPDQTDDVKRIKVCRVEDVCKMTFKEGQTPRTRVKNLVMPLRYEGEKTSISDDFKRQVRQALENLKNRQGVKIRFIGYTDDAPLTPSEESTYGNQLSLSKARALRVALAM